jgi:thiol-disulfide isomerase/thioredoxin
MGTQRGSEAIDLGRRRLLSTTAIGIAAFAIVGSLFPAVVQQLASAAGSPDNELASLGGATAWLNTEPLTSTGLRGKVVLVDFWTYTCINWLRTEPYVRAWEEKYRHQGLVVIGVHTPEFPFEHDIDNVRRAVEVMKLPYPIAVDSDYAIWRGFNNHYWPALYFVDAQGRVRHQQFGEGAYAEAERFIQQLLVEAGTTGVAQDLVSVEGRGFEAPADWANLKSEENYVGYERTEGFASPGGATLGQPRVYAVPAQLGLTAGPSPAIGPSRRGERAQQGRWAHRLSVPRPRSSSRHGTHGQGEPGTIPGAHRWQAAGRGPRIGCRRAGHGHGRGAAALSARPSADAHHRTAIRDRVPRAGRRGLWVHVRLTARRYPSGAAPIGSSQGD